MPPGVGYSPCMGIFCWQYSIPHQHSCTGHLLLVVRNRFLIHEDRTEDGVNALLRLFRKKHFEICKWDDMLNWWQHHLCMPKETTETNVEWNLESDCRFRNAPTISLCTLRYYTLLRGYVNRGNDVQMSVEPFHKMENDNDSQVWCIANVFSIFKNVFHWTSSSSSFIFKTARVRRFPWYEASQHIPEHCPFRVQTKLNRVILYTFSPKSFCFRSHISPLPPPHFYRPIMLEHYPEYQA